MNFRQITPFMILMFFIALMLQVGCDTLVTENNEIILFDSTLGEACVDACHTDNDNLLVRPDGQFKNSAHANFANLDILVDEDGNKCGGACHTHNGFINAISSAGAKTNVDVPLNCYTCHLPHTGEYNDWDIKIQRGSESSVLLVSGESVALGLEIGSPSNTCVNCHKAVNTVNTVIDASIVKLNADFGPRVSPQADILSEKNGFFVEISTPPENSHIDNGCINCHYGSTTIKQGQGYTYAEHTFRLEDQNSQYNVTCNKSGCHPNTANANEIDKFYDRPAIVDIDTLSSKVIALLESFEIIDSTNESGLTYYTVGDSVPIIYAKAYYNYLLYKNDGSRGIHNPGFVNTLLSNTRTVLDSLPPIFSFIVDDSTGCSGLGGQTMTFTPSLVGGFDELIWNFDDGTADTTTADTAVFKTYADSGIYDVSLEVLSKWVDNNSDTMETRVSQVQEGMVIIDTVPFVDFAVDYTNANPTDSTFCFGDEVSFINSSTHLGQGTHTWDFGYGLTLGQIINFGDDATASQIYDTVGTFDVSLTVVTECGDITVNKLGLITIGGVMPIIDTTAVDTVYTLTSNSLGIVDSIAWDWDNDGTIDGTSNPIEATYTHTGALQVIWAKLTVFTSDGVCTDQTDSVLILIQP